MKKFAEFFRKNAVWMGLAFFFLLFLQIYSRALLDRSDGVYATHPYVWSDWSLHVAMTNLFAYEPLGEWFRHHPVWSGGGFTYPFLTNLIPALLMRLGLGLTFSMNTSALVFSWIFLWGAVRLGLRLTKSLKITVIALFIFIFSSGHRGLGFWAGELLRIVRGEWTLESFLALPPDPSRIEAQSWLAGNVLEATIFPQRAMLLGMAIGVWALVFWYRGKDRGGSWNRSWVLSGLLMGLLPIAHMHTLIALVIVFPCILYSELRSRRYAWLKNYLPGGALAALLYAFFVHGKIQNQSFIVLDPFWTADGPFSWIALWYSIWGIFLPLSLLAEGSRFRKLGIENAPASESFSFSFGFFLLFLVSNFVLFQPMHWDNSKLFFWCYFGLSFSVASLLVVFHESTKLKYRLFSWVCFILLISTGTVEVLRVVNYGRETYQMTDRSLIDLGEKIRNEVHPREVFLTAPTHNHFISLWATQPIFMGYSAWAMNYGFPWVEREKLLKELLSGRMEESAFQAEIASNHIRYVVIGPDERRYLPELHEEFFSKAFKQAFEAPGVRIYDLSQRIGKP